MSNLYNTIKTLCSERGLSIGKMCTIAGVSQGSITDLKMGRRKTVTLPVAQKIATALNVPVTVLLDDEAQKEKAPSQRAKGVRISVLGHVAAGVPIEAIEDEVDWEDIPAEWVRGGQEYFGLKVQGDSMYPKYLEGDTVIVRKAVDCESGQDCVVYVNGYDATLKTIKKQEDGSLMLVPFNREYPPKTFARNEVTELPVVICGVVVELRRKI